MDTNLPNLDIIEDIEEVMNDNEPQQAKQSVEEQPDETQEVEDEPEDKSPFVKPQKKKKELSEKQKAHLQKIRKLAVEKKKR